jgi:hypothetical protein
MAFLARKGVKLDKVESTGFPSAVGSFSMRPNEPLPDQFTEIHSFVIPRP